jgi:hypothetical protein
MELIRIIANLPTPFNMVVFIMALGCFSHVVHTMFVQTQKYLTHREDLEFKRELVARGLSPQEIERIAQVQWEPSRDAEEVDSGLASARHA